MEFAFLINTGESYRPGQRLRGPGGVPSYLGDNERGMEGHLICSGGTLGTCEGERPEWDWVGSFVALHCPGDCKHLRRQCVS